MAGVGAPTRSLVGDASAFIVLSTVALLGMGFGNVVGTLLVKKHFPDRQAVMLTVFALLMQVGDTLPAFTALPTAESSGWRPSLASWSIISFLAVIPWAVQLFKAGRKNPADQPQSAAAAGQDTEDRSFPISQMLHSPVVVGTGLFYAMASFNTYAVLAWLLTPLGIGVSMP